MRATPRPSRLASTNPETQRMVLSVKRGTAHQRCASNPRARCRVSKRPFARALPMADLQYLHAIEGLAVEAQIHGARQRADDLSSKEAATSRVGTSPSNRHGRGIARRITSPNEDTSVSAAITVAQGVSQRTRPNSAPPLHKQDRGGKSTSSLPSVPSAQDLDEELRCRSPQSQPVGGDCRQQ